MIAAPDRASSFAPSAAILASAVLWGTFWIPLRHLDAAGLGGAWATAASFILPFALLLPFAVVRLRSLVAGGGGLLAMGLLVSLTIALYAEGLLRGQVARVILLFYLTPVWSSLLGRAMLGEPITRGRVATIVLGLSGMLVIFGVDQGVPLPRSLADWMALLAGIVWGFALVYLRRCETRPLFDRVFAQSAFLGPCFLGLALIPGGRSLAAPQWTTLVDAGPVLLVFALVWMLPVFWLTAYGGGKLDPGRVAILLMFEVVVGLATAAVLTDEPFGAREAVGAALIMTASLGEFLGGKRKRAGTARG